MLQALKQRGPHGQELYIEGQVGLGCTHLYLSSQHNEQPSSYNLPRSAVSPWSLTAVWTTAKN